MVSQGEEVALSQGEQGTGGGGKGNRLWTNKHTTLVNTYSEYTVIPPRVSV